MRRHQALGCTRTSIANDTAPSATYGDRAAAKVSMGMNRAHPRISPVKNSVSLQITTTTTTLQGKGHRQGACEGAKRPGSVLPG
jgi:hypothetical protein